MGICKKMTKKLLGALLAFAMLVSIAPLPAQAIEGIDGKIVVVIGDKEYDMTELMKTSDQSPYWDDPLIIDDAIGENPTIKVTGTDIYQISVSMEGVLGERVWKAMISDHVTEREMDLFDANRYGNNKYKITVGVDNRILRGSVQINDYTLPSMDDMKAKLDEAKAIQADGYTEESYAELQKVIKSVNNTVIIYKNRLWDAKQSIFDNQLSKLETAIANLEQAGSGADFTNLQKLYEDTVNYKAEGVTGFDVFQEQLEKTKKLLDDPTATQEEIDKQFIQLDGRYTFVRLKEMNKENQDVLFDHESMYATSSLKALAEIYAAVQDKSLSKALVLKQADVDKAKAWLSAYEEAVKSLIPASKDDMEIGTYEKAMARGDNQGEFALISSQPLMVEGTLCKELTIRFTNNAVHPLFGESYTNYDGDETAFAKYGGTKEAVMKVTAYDEQFNAIEMPWSGDEDFKALEGNSSKTPGFETKIIVDGETKYVTMEYTYNWDKAYSAGYWVIDNIPDMDAPTAEVMTSNNDEATDSPVTVTIKANEAIQPVEGWTLSDDQTILTKVFTENTTGTVTITDLAGNVSQIAYKVSGIEIPSEEAASEAALEALRDMVEKAIALGSEEEALNAAITAAQAVLAKDAPTATEVVSALLDLSAAMQDLSGSSDADALRADVQATIDFINEHILSDMEGLRPGKVQALVNAVKAAQDVVDDPDATADELKAANRAMTKAAQELWEIVSKAELNALIEAANGYLEGDYTAESLEALQTALTAAQDTASNDDATTAEVTEAITNLADAIANLEKVTLDTSALEHEIELVIEMIANIDDYVPSSVEGLQDKLDAAKTVLSNAVSQEEIDEAVKSLREARLNARTKADVSALKELIAYVNSLDLNAYTSASIAVMNAPYTKALKMIADEEATQEMVDQLAEEMQTAIDALEPIDVSITTPDSDNVNDYCSNSTAAKGTDTAATAQTGMMLGLLFAAGIAVAGVFMYRRKIAK